jgi:hypothetical protein
MLPSNAEILKAVRGILVSPESPKLSDMPPYMFKLGGSQGLVRLEAPEEVHADICCWGDYTRHLLLEKGGFVMVAILIKEDNTEVVLVTIYKNEGSDNVSSYQFDLIDFEKNENPKAEFFDIRGDCPDFGHIYH